MEANLKSKRITKLTQVGRIANRLLNPVSVVTRTAKSAWKPLRDGRELIVELATIKGHSAASTFEDTLLNRPKDAMPLRELEDYFLQAKRMCAIFFWLAGGSLIACATLGNLAGILSALAACIGSFTLGYRAAFRLAQLRRHELFSIQAFRAKPGWFGYVIDPEFLSTSRVFPSKHKKGK
jgi:hypothetical protein